MNVITKYLVLPLLVASLPLAVHASEDEQQQKFTVQLQALNGSGVTGDVEIKIKKGKILKIQLEANGLEGNKIHPQHIHGLTSPADIATCPDLSADLNADGLISVGEGAPFYGPIVLPLTPFDLVSENGELRYEASFTINPASIQPLGKRTIVLHGMTVNGEYIASLPIACGQVEFKN